MEKYCLSLEIAKKLKELEVKQESEFYWVSITGSVWSLHDKKRTIGFIEKYNLKFYYSAFCVGELGEILPSCVYSEELEDWFYFRQFKGSGLDHNHHLIVYRNCNHEDLHGEQDLEVLARGKMLIYLLENNLIKLPLDKPI